MGCELGRYICFVLVSVLSSIGETGNFHFQKAAIKLQLPK